jgi:membrane-bound metal-dependent hydrolase YbcI (DUF457 family)
MNGGKRLLPGTKEKFVLGSLIYVKTVSQSLLCGYDFMMISGYYKYHNFGLRKNNVFYWSCHVCH